MFPEDQQTMKDNQKSFRKIRDALFIGFTLTNKREYLSQRHMVEDLMSRATQIAKLTQEVLNQTLLEDIERRKKGG